jgi:hypothetical protein
MTPQSVPPSSRSANTEDYRHVVLLRVHELLRLGYHRLDRAACRTAQEEKISGDLADSIDDVLDERPEEWMDFFSVHNESPVRDPPRKGKRRRKVDIRIDSSRHRPRTRFAFEAKRLGRGHGVSKYLGQQGLGRFLRGEYAAREAMAGMLGYVQSGSSGEWAQRIARTLARSPGEYRVVENGNWRPARLVDGLEHTYCSTHDRPGVNAPIDVYHTLLSFL